MGVLNRVLALALVAGFVGGVVGYAASVHVARIYVLVTQPAAEVKTYTLKIERAPYQTFEYYAAELASVRQHSDRVRYTVHVKAVNVTIYKICIWVGYFMTTYFSECVPPDHAYTFVIDRGKHSPTFSISAGYIHARTQRESGEITVEIAYEAVA